MSRSRLRGLFHGTSAELQPGDRILPAGVTGVVQAHPSTAGHRPAEFDGARWAHATSNENTAWEFAQRAAHYVHRGSGRNYNTPAPAGTSRARVYRVEPEGESQLGVENRRHPHFTGHDNQEHIAQAFRVVEAVDIQPPADGLFVDVPKAGGRGTKRGVQPNLWGRQGTLPVDWAPVTGEHPAFANHPHPQEDADAFSRAKHFGDGAHVDSPHAELPGQLEMFGKPKNTGLCARQRVLRGG